MRFSVLDSWRGLCALWVALYHFRVVGHLSENWVTRHGFIAVDFFFTLSGFVIAHAYGESLNSFADRVRFFIRRFGRLYPLHIATLAVVVAMEGVRWGAGKALGQAIGPPTFSGDTSLVALVANLGLVHGLGGFLNFTWNVPSWSISVELAVCLIFALVSILRRPLIAAIALAAGAAVLLIWQSHHFLGEGQTALTRGVCGFFLGVLAQRAYAAFRARSWTLPGWVELATPVLAFLAMWSWGKGIWPASGALFAVIVFIFAFEAGLLSRLMKRPFLMRWGEVSYSIYLVHYPLVMAIFGAATAISALTGMQLLTSGRWFALELGSRWIGDIASIVFLVVVILISGVTYRWIEVPGRRWFNSLSDNVGERLSNAGR